MKDNKSYLLVAIAIVVALVIGYVVGHAPKNDETDKASLYLPVYEFTSDANGDTYYSYDFEINHGFGKYALKRVVPCQYEICKWIKKENSIVTSSWIMYDNDDKYLNDNAKGGYYFYDQEKDKMIAGPFETIEFEEVHQIEGAFIPVNKVIVQKDDKYGLFDIEKKDYLLPFGSSHISFEDLNKVLYEKDGKYYYYLYEGREKLTIGEYNSLEEYYTANGLEGDIEEEELEEDME